MNELRVVIVEDEPATARNLIRMLQDIDKRILVEAKLTSVSEAVVWFTANTTVYDLVFMDIRLADGLSFDIFNQTMIDRPVIFVTAYNDYALDAFKNNGIDYILKPFDQQEIGKALEKYKRLTGAGAPAPDRLPLKELAEQLLQLKKNYRKSFLVHYRDKLIPVESAKVCWFYTANEIVYAHVADNRQYVIDLTMEQLDKELDPEVFFRANRQFIVNRAAIQEVNFYFNGRLSLKVNPETPEKVLISKARVPEFKSWMNK
ncbi:LytTR family DNA-binding domain-containing protein [Mucilaginibacter sp. RS28]|uniref:LytTR family DNA-binding domain-containing protein n=1 Tax=Mucilaginibacter straminoryzae TaxID=2932774 RepID=A0A9X1X1V1_9SPHI|nr:LytTR family DNA-binding domain-containing protein [Mucilaginibacter straminoryzae]MCJ8208820.1 LytTR family DNA-binding domain-containing protein [Mucilaginibacter straminoryzae]